MGLGSHGPWLTKRIKRGDQDWTTLFASAMVGFARFSLEPPCVAATS